MTQIGLAFAGVCPRVRGRQATAPREPVDQPFLPYILPEAPSGLLERQSTLPGALIHEDVGNPPISAHTPHNESNRLPPTVPVARVQVWVGFETQKFSGDKIFGNIKLTVDEDASDAEVVALMCSRQRVTGV